MECMEHCHGSSSNGRLAVRIGGEGDASNDEDHQVLANGCSMPHRRQQLLPMGSGNGSQPQQMGFTRDIISFSLYGKLSPKCKRPWNESLSSKIAEVQESFKNIPSMLYFSPSSVSFDGIGVYTAEALPKGTMLGPYFGRTVRREQIEYHTNSEWLWEVYEDSSLAYFIDASDPKYGNWMNFIQCARNQLEQNLKALQCKNCLYFEATKDIVVSEELLVWYDAAQYDLHMGIPTKHVGSGPTYALHEGPEMERSTSGFTASDMMSPTNPPPPPLRPAPARNGLSDASTGTDDSGTDSTSVETPPSMMEPPCSMHDPPLYPYLPSQKDPVRYTPPYNDQTQPPPIQYPLPIGPDDSWPKPVEARSIYDMFTKTEDGTRWRCNECKRLFSSQGSLRAHARIHTGERPYQCQYCHRNFCQASTLRSHERLHTGEKPYKCEHCGRAFTQSAGLRSHLKTHRFDS